MEVSKSCAIRKCKNTKALFTLLLPTILRPEKITLIQIALIWLVYDCHHFRDCCDLTLSLSLPMCGFIAQLVEHRTGIVDVTGSNPVEALIFFQASSFQLLWKINCDDHSSLSFTAAVQIHYELFHIYFTSFHSSRERYELN